MPFCGVGDLFDTRIGALPLLSHFCTSSIPIDQIFEILIPNVNSQAPASSCSPEFDIVQHVGFWDRTIWHSSTEYKYRINRRVPQKTTVRILQSLHLNRYRIRFHFLFSLVRRSANVEWERQLERPLRPNDPINASRYE